MTRAILTYPSAAVVDPTGKYRQPQHRGPNGRKLCRWCHSEVPKRRSSWCSDACVEAYRLETDWGFIRGRVYDRDNGVCAMCERDTNALQRILRAMNRGAAESLKAEMGFNPCQWELWQADHIQPRHLGGGNSLDNLRTLCVPCHKLVTAAQVRAIAARRRVECAA